MTTDKYSVKMCNLLKEYSYSEIYIYNQYYYRGETVKLVKNGFGIVKNVNERKCIIGFWKNNKLDGISKIFIEKKESNNFLDNDVNCCLYMEGSLISKFDSTFQLISHLPKNKILYSLFFKMKFKELISLLEPI